MSILIFILFIFLLNFIYFMEQQINFIYFYPPTACSSLRKYQRPLRSPLSSGARS